ncbi:MAG: 2-dehydropantoate 2-reductase [Betaproteobacteria bacterium]|nr:MAG: 2-dehydropantoate 2-reductase [Betaproteobacteria bacterium]
MRFVIVGAGAMGSLFAAHVARTEAEIWVCDKWQQHIDAIRSHGLVVRCDGAEAAVRLRATSDPREPGTADVVMIFVKYNQTRDALHAMRPLVGPRTALLTLQNGLGNVELIREAFPENRVFYGFTTLTSELLGPGRIEASYAGRGETYLWAQGGSRDAELEALRSLLESGGINAIIAPEIELMIWKKLIVNCCLNTLCAITGLSVGQLADNAESWPVLEGVADEIVAVATRKAIPLDSAQAREFLRSVAHEARSHFPSMLIDVKQGRQTEIECLNGAIIREAAKFGIPTPFNRTLYSLIRIIESKAIRAAQ